MSRVRRLRIVAWIVAAAVLLPVAALALLLALEPRAPAPARESAPAPAATPEQVERGAYLALAGNCAGCHTARGGTPYAGGRAIETPFGVAYSSNLTPDAETGIGAWSRDDFWRALHHGVSRDGRRLVPAFPYPSYTLVSRDDADAIHAWLRTLPAVRQPNQAHRLRFPYGTQAALAVWRALFFDPGTFVAEADRPPAWNRGAYLVRGLGHCEACHSPRNVLGATRAAADLGGGLLPTQHWYAPSLASTREAGLADWPLDEGVGLLRTGVTARASVLGPMAEVVLRSTQYLAEDDLRAIVVYLQDLPRQEAPPAPAAASGADAAASGPETPPTEQQLLGAAIYERHCAGCHGDDGRGAPGAYRPLAGNRAVLLDDTTNLVRIVVDGGCAPATEGHPRPYGMPPFGAVLDDDEIAAVLTHLRSAWGNVAEAVPALAVLRRR